MSDLQKHVDAIAKQLTAGFDDALNDDGEPVSAFDYLADALDIQWVCARDKSYHGARVLVAFGGPNIWINTRTKTVEGHWWGEKAVAEFEDTAGLDEACEELFQR